MNFLKFKQKKAPEPNLAVQTSSYSKKEHPFYSISKYNTGSKNHQKLYLAIREAVPIIDAAISKIIRLIGNFKIVCDDKQIEYEINKFLLEIQVGSSRNGVDSFIATYLDQLLTFGTSVGEIVPNNSFTDISALYNASLKDVELKVGENPLELLIYRKEIKGENILVEYPEFILISSLNPVPGEVYGTSILKGLPFVSDILLKIYHSVGTNWERVGNVRFAVTYNPGNESMPTNCAQERANQIVSAWQKAMQNTNGVSDFVAVGDVNIKVIGADNQILDSNIPAKQMLEQIVSKLSIPPFLLGLSWSSTERMSSQQADILTSELETYRRLLNPVISKICSLWMRLNGINSHYSIEWNDINLQDEVQTANAKLLSAKAQEIEKKLREND